LANLLTYELADFSLAVAKRFFQQFYFIQLNCCFVFFSEFFETKHTERSTFQNT